MHQTFGSLKDGQRRDFTTRDILRSIEETVLLAFIPHRQIEELKQWATQAGARNASVDTLLSEELRHRSTDYGIKPLEID